MFLGGWNDLKLRRYAEGSYVQDGTPQSRRRFGWLFDQLWKDPHFLEINQQRQSGPAGTPFGLVFMRDVCGKPDISTILHFPNVSSKCEGVCMSKFMNVVRFQVKPEFKDVILSKFAAFERPSGYQMGRLI